MESRLYAKALMELALREGCSGAEVCITENDEFSVGVLEGNVEEYSVSSTFALGLRVQLNGHNGYAYSEVMEDKERLVKEAMDSARSVMTEEEHPMAEPALYPEVPAKEDAYANLDEQGKIQLCKDLEQQALKVNDMVQRVAICRVVTAGGKFSIYNTRGLKAERSDRISCCYVEPVIKSGEELKDGFAFRADKEAMDIEGCAKEAVDEAVAQLNASPVPGGNYKILLRNDAAASLLGAFSGMFSADAVQKGLSALAGKEGEIVASELITIVDDPLLAYNPAAFDDEGTPSVCKNVVEKGRLNTYLHNLKTAKKAGVKSTSNGGRGSAGSPVGVRPTNFFIQAGDKTFDELVKELDCGLIITDFSGMHAGVNPISGKFSLLCKGRKVENGQDVGAVNEITLSGGFEEMLKAVSAVGNDMRFSMPGGSSFGSPSLIVESMSVSGRG